jgi:hypothetical protein
MRGKGVRTVDLPIRLKGPVECPDCGTISVVAGRIWGLIQDEYGPWHVIEIPCQCNRYGRMVWIPSDRFPGITEFTTRCDTLLLGRGRISDAESLEFLLALSEFTLLPDALVRRDP